MSWSVRIKYYYVVNWKTKNNCEYFKGDCYRFIPEVYFIWDGTVPPTLSKFSAYYKLDYGPVGVALTSDSNNFAGNVLVNTGKQKIETKETKFRAVTDGKEGDFDNIHTAHKGQNIVTPGCRTLPHLSWTLKFPAFDCVHTHWRWSSTGVVSEELPGSLLNWFPNIDPLIDPSTDESIQESKRGEPYLVPDQTIDVAIVKLPDDPEEVIREDDPSDPSSLVNGETIAYTATQNQPTGSGEIVDRSLDVLDRAEHIVVWYSASVSNKNFDRFFRYGIYMMDPKEEHKVTTTTSLPQILLKLDTDLNSLDLSKKSQQEISGYLSQAMSSTYWTRDGTTLIPDKGEKVFAQLSQSAVLIEQMKLNDPKASESLDLATSTILSIIEHAVLNAMKSDTDYIQQASSNLGTYDDSKVFVFAKSQPLKLAMQFYRAAVSEPDLNKSTDIIENFRLSWLNTIKGMEQVSSEIGVDLHASGLSRPTWYNF